MLVAGPLTRPVLCVAWPHRHLGCIQIVVSRKDAACMEGALLIDWHASVKAATQQNSWHAQPLS